MKQLIARIDEDLHARLKRRAAEEGRSLNALVTEALAEAVREPEDLRAAFREKLRREGMLVEPEVTGPVPTWDEVVEAGRGFGSTVSEELMRQRRGE